MGMNRMRERARLAGGDPFVFSSPGDGTRVTARVLRHPEAVCQALARRGDGSRPPDWREILDRWSMLVR